MSEITAPEECSSAIESNTSATGGASSRADEAYLRRVGEWFASLPRSPPNGLRCAERAMDAARYGKPSASNAGLARKLRKADEATAAMLLEASEMKELTRQLQHTNLAEQGREEHVPAFADEWECFAAEFEAAQPPVVGLLSDEDGEWLVDDDGGPKDANDWLDTLEGGPAASASAAVTATVAEEGRSLVDVDEGVLRECGVSLEEAVAVLEASRLEKKEFPVSEGGHKAVLPAAFATKSRPEGEVGSSDEEEDGVEGEEEAEFEEAEWQVHSQ
jgi:hypothetical protein